MQKNEIGWQIWTNAPIFPTLWRVGMVQQETLLAGDLNACREMPFAGDALCSPTFARHAE